MYIPMYLFYCLLGLRDAVCFGKFSSCFSDRRRYSNNYMTSGGRNIGVSREMCYNLMHYIMGYLV